MKPDLEEFEEGCCPSCGEELVDEEATRPVCSCCDARLKRELAAYLELVAAMRSRCRRQGRGCARLAVRGVEETPTGTDRYQPEPKGGTAVQMTVGTAVGSRRRSLRPISGRMRHFRLSLLTVGVLSLVAEAVAAAAVFGPQR